MSNPVLISLRTATSDRALVTQLERGEARTSFALPIELAEHPDLGQPLTRLQESLAGVAQGLSDIAGNYSATGFDPIALERTASIAPAFRLVVEAQRSAMQRLEGERTNLHTPAPVESLSVTHRRIEMRAHVRNLKPEAVIALAKADSDVAAAIVEGGAALSGLPGPAFDMIQRDFAVATLAERILSGGTLPRIAPSIADPIGGAADVETARRNAADRLSRLDDEIALLKAVPGVLSNVVTAVSILTGESREAALARLA
ncbi:hypothetical protein [Erythrobacter sp.]|uniref:hypothetical protein n=1 Tax=Erythrobacter sp. TaxID=1042 RepID=UPI0025E217CF|nr:hypothetical protein [Erythrobacter sp.]